MWEAKASELTLPGPVRESTSVSSSQSEFSRDDAKDTLDVYSGGGVALMNNDSPLDLLLWSDVEEEKRCNRLRTSFGIKVDRTDWLSAYTSFC
jgi:hypothetical protein